MRPLVSVIAISYNQVHFIEEALNSLFAQEYEPMELIIIDDGSRDGSVEKIQKLISDRDMMFVQHPDNLGYTKTFNEGLKMANGRYIVDFSLDDVMLPNFLSRSVDQIESVGDSYGLVFSNADYINKDGDFIANHKELLFQKRMLKEIPSGDVFQWILRRYFICTPTMLMSKDMLDKLGGYDADLAYEDFDLWVRASRYWKFIYLDEVLFQKRKLKSSLSTQRHRHQYNDQMNSVYAVCQKAFHLCKTKEDLSALYERLNYEYRQCVKHGAESLADQYIALLRTAGGKLSLKSSLYRLYKRKFRVIR